MTVAPAVAARGVSFRYGDRVACDDITFEVARGEVHGFLGPNGSGKSTLFKILTTIYPLQRGDVRILGLDLARERSLLRSRLGVVFQAPALDRKLTVRQNLVYGGYLYGMRGRELEARVDQMLETTALGERAGDRVETLSGGLRRRVELAKGLLHGPEVLLLDEPSTGLDPGARGDLWRFLRSIDQVTVLFTTHLMDEADRADQITILHDGRVVAQGAPAILKRQIGEEILEVECKDPDFLAGAMRESFDVEVTTLGSLLRVQRDDAHRLVASLMERFGDHVGRVTLSHPTLEDVYIQSTGHRFWSEREGAGR